jgi:8-oxo-dGTP pyrophosphatase MutT (NUDIX family)
MTFVGLSRYVMILLPIGSPIGSDIKLAMQREPLTCKILFLVGSMLVNEEPVDAVVRELVEETSLPPSVYDLTMSFFCEAVRVPLPDNKTLSVSVYVASVPTP